MENKKIYFEEADRPPASYYDNDISDDIPLKKVPFKTIDPEEWLKAPEFIPRSRLNEAFDLPPQFSSTNALTTDDCHGYSNVLAHFPANQMAFPPALQSIASSAVVLPSMVPNPITSTASNMSGQNLPTFTAHPSATLTGIPQGYSANLTSIQAGFGTPIPAIVLRKKRRKRNRHTNSVLSSLNSHETEMTEVEKDVQPDSANVPTQIIEEQSHEKLIGGSCPDLSEDQLQMWDDYLYNTAVGSIDYEAAVSNSDKKNNNDIMISSAEQHVQGITSSEIRSLDKKLTENPMTTSTVMRKLNERKTTSDAKTEKTLASELNAVNHGDTLQFRPQLTKYGYPQIDSSNVQMATFHPDGVRTEIVRKYSSDDDRFEEDCFEGMNITVNAFDACEDLTLSDVENSSGQSRFNQIQKALKRNSLRSYDVGLKPPERVCCSLM
ncbi:unnamed protein product [Auanema sp. JU1783]|nr:unnamed protein product [Auanema sp. JU1783]